MKSSWIRLSVILFSLILSTNLYAQWEKSTATISRDEIYPQRAVERPHANQVNYPAGRFVISPDNDGILDFDTTLAHNLQQIIDTVRSKYGVPGISASVLIPEKGTWNGVCGYSTLDPPVDIQPNMISCIGSCTKSFISAIMLKLTEEGKLSLDDSIGTYLPNLPANIPGNITIRQLLHMTSGLWDYINMNNAGMDSIFANPEKYWTNEEIINQLVGPPQAPPGTVYQYCNTNLVLAGMIIKNVTQTNISTQLHQRIFEPLSFQRTYFSPEVTLVEPIAHPWSAGIDIGNSYHEAFFSLVAAAGGIFSTSEELARWTDGLFTEKILSHDLLTEMLRSDSITAHSGVGRYGLCVYSSFVLGKEAWGHDGGINGYLAKFFFYPAHGISIAIWQNDDYGPSFIESYNLLLHEYLKTINVHPAQSGNMYTLSTTQSDSGDVYFADPLTAATRIVGNSLYGVLYEGRVHPKTGDFWGIALNQLGWDLVKIDGMTGEAFPRALINLPQPFSSKITAMDFSSDGNLYVGASDGKIYTVDTSSGLGTLIVSPPIPLSGFVFQPGTGTLWASVQQKQNFKDRLFKINLQTGDTIGVGNTGFAQALSDIAFDSQGNLFGIVAKGTGFPNPRLAKIDTSTGRGTEIGSFGVPGINAIAFSSGEANGIVFNHTDDHPLNFNLSQNYPNPFNPSTTIRYAIPSRSHVKLVIYDILGREVATLVDGTIVGGYHEVTWNAEKFSSGVYIYRLQTGKWAQSKKLVLLK